MTIDGRFTLEGRIGSGAFGEVWRARSRTGPVAVKLLKIHEGWARRRFEVEARALDRLDHPHILELITFGVLDSGQPYLVTEYVDGEPLSEWAEGRTDDERLDVALQLVDAIDDAHRCGVVHRDLKPTNVIVTDGHVTVLDFGIARLVNSQQSNITKTGEVIGSPGYMSPEQLLAEPGIGPPTDVYALGVMLFELFSGRHPFHGETPIELSIAHLNESAPPLTTGPAHVREVVARMLDKQATRRPNLRDVARSLEGREPKSQREVEERERAPIWQVVAGVLLGLGALALLLREKDPSPPPQPPLSRTFGAATLLKKGSDPKPLAIAPDAGAAKAVDLGGSLGCGVAHDGQTRVAVRGQSFDIEVRLPATYDPHVPAPVLLALHDMAQRPEDLTKIEDLNALADRDGVVIVAPAAAEPMPEVPVIRHLPAINTWLYEEDRKRVQADIELVAVEVCLDLDRIYVWGHGNGVVAAQCLAREMPGVVALAMTSHREWSDRKLCADGTAPPTIFIAPLDDPSAPLGDDEDCFGHRNKWTLDQHEGALRELHQCADKRRTLPRRKSGTCWTSECESDFVWCRAEGGRDWKSMPSRKAISGERELGFRTMCKNVPGKFDYANVIWEFFRTPR